MGDGVSVTIPDRPLLHQSFLDYVEPLLPGALVLEFGAGASTLWFAQRARFVWSVEEDDDWANAVESQIKLDGYRGDVLRAAHTKARIPAPDIMLIDGRKRGMCLSTCVLFDDVLSGGLVAMDDAQRERYSGAVALADSWSPKPRIEFPWRKGVDPDERRDVKLYAWIAP